MAKTAQSTYLSCHYTIRTQILSWGQPCEVERMGFWWWNWPNCNGPISNNSSFSQKHPGVPDSSDRSDGNSYPMTDNYTLPVAQATGRIAWHQQNVFQPLEASRSVWEDVECKLRCVNFRRVSDRRRAFLPALRVTGSADDKPGSTWERWWQVWEHLESQSCIQFVFSSIYLCIYSYPSTHAISGLAAGGAWEQFEVRLKMTIDWTQRYSTRPWSSDIWNPLGSRDRVN